MIRRPQFTWRSLVVLAIIVNAGLLFVVLPEVSSRLHRMYNQDEYADGYDQLATNLVEGHGYRMYPDTAATMMREPGYPILLAGIFLVFGKNFVAVKLANMLLAFGAAWLMTRIARRFSTSQVLILGAPLLFLLHPGTLIAESRGGVEVLFTFLLTLFVLTLYRAIENKRWSDYVLSGVVLGVTVLVKSTPMLFPVFLLAYLVVFERGSSIRKICLHIAVMVVAMLVALSPWIIRNYSLTGKFIPTATVLGVSAHAGQYVNTHLPADGSWALVDREAARERRKIAEEMGYRFKDVKDAYYQDFYASGDEVKFSDYLFQMVVGEYERSPMMFVRCVRSNLFNLWFRGKTRNSTLLNVIVQLPYLVLAIIGVVLAVRNGQIKIIAPIVLLLIYAVAVYVVILAQARYSVPLTPFLSILAGISLIAAQRRLEGTNTTSSGRKVEHAIAAFSLQDLALSSGYACASGTAVNLAGIDLYHSPANVGGKE
jgi:4-amino-4-deoxy-L-arabinose transferase-like glycosyltransferase